MKSTRHCTHRTPRGFSLLEVLLATFILGIGLIMVASVFPVGANWTRESTQNSVAQTIALNALSVIQAHYGPGSSDANHTGANSLSNKIITAGSLQGLPNFTGANGIPVVERCYQFGSNVPFPATNPNACLYYWTALARPTQGSNGASHDLYIFVFRKGDATQTFTVPSGATLAGGGNPTSDAATPTNFPKYNYLWEPILVQDNYSGGTWDPTTQTVINAVPPVGYIGIGVTSGTVFRQTLNINYSTLSSSTAAAQPGIVNSPVEQVIYAPHPDGISGSPLIYVYQTTVPF